MDRLRQTQLAWAALGVACLAAAGALQETRRTDSDLLEILPGRAFIINYLWIRADRLKEEGRFYDAMQQAQLICRLQRRFPGVWSFCSWNMAWNISVATHTPEERWRWVYSGVRLLRDEAIPLNPKSIVLYKDLGWIFFFKIGGYLDDMHWVYKRQWAMRMQDLLGAPPQGTTDEVIDAFRPVAEEGFLDKDPRRQGRVVIQPERLQELLKAPDVQACADALKQAGVGVDQKLLAAYNQYSLDEPVRVVRVKPPNPKTDRAHALYNAINDPDHAEARARLLAFVRAQILWNVYRMDPKRMLDLMEQYGPLDWRLPQPHGLYWLKLGLETCGDAGLQNVDALNTQRNVLNCLKELTWRGRMTMVDARDREATEDALSLEPVSEESQMQLPNIEIGQFGDLRYIPEVHEEFLGAIETMLGQRHKHLSSSPLATGHINFLRGAIKMLYAARRQAEAQRYLDWVRRAYGRKGQEWSHQDVEDFVLYELRRETQLSRDLAESMISMSLLVGFVAASRDDMDTYQESLTLARRAHAAYQEDRPERMHLPRFERYSLMIATRLIGNPRGAGYNVSLADRSNLYRKLLRDSPPVARIIYERLRRLLKRQCEDEGLDFDKAFPPPPKQLQPEAGDVQPSGAAPGR